MQDPDVHGLPLAVFPPEAPSQYVLRDVAQSARELGFDVVERGDGLVTRQLGRLAWHSRKLWTRWPRLSNPTILPLMGPQRNAIARISVKRRVIPYAFDCWPQHYPMWDELFTIMRPPVAAFTARAAAQHYQNVLATSTVLWLPEALHERRIQAGHPLINRSTHVLELGRRYGRYHDVVMRLSEHISMRHLYEVSPGLLIFPTIDALAKGYKDSQIVVCFPASRTHPERSGATATITQRYLEAMASGCLIVGESPAELVSIFGYDPAVAVDWESPEKQLAAILKSIGSFQDLVFRNTQRLRETCLWGLRLRELAQAIEVHLN